MKKATLIISAIALIFSANAQNRGSSDNGTPKKYTKALEKRVLNNSNRAAGDTLMWMPLPDIYINPTDQANFTVVGQDVDNFTHANGLTTLDKDFGVFYDTDSSVTTNGGPTGSNFYHPWENPAPNGTDSTFFWYAISYFNPAPQQANNWLMFGPITIPAAGATLKWFDRTRNYRDGYEVKVSSSFSTPLDFADYSGAAIFTETDAAEPSPTYAQDTLWEARSVTIPSSYNGQQVSIAFHHNATDMFFLFLDEILVLEGTGANGVEENFVNGVKFSQNMPNPFSKSTSIRYELQTSNNVTLNVYDVTGKKVAEVNEGQQSAGYHAIKFNAENLSVGVYYYTLKVGENTTAAKKMVIVK